MTKQEMIALIAGRGYCCSHISDDTLNVFFHKTKETVVEVDTRAYPPIVRVGSMLIAANLTIQGPPIYPHESHLDSSIERSETDVIVAIDAVNTALANRAKGILTAFKLQLDAEKTAAGQAQKE